MKKTLVNMSESLYVNGVLTSHKIFDKDLKVKNKYERDLDDKGNVIEIRRSCEESTTTTKMKYNTNNKVTSIEDSRGLNVHIYYTISGLVSKIEGIGDFKLIELPIMNKIRFKNLKVFNDKTHYNSIYFMYHGDLLTMIKTSTDDLIKMEFIDAPEGVYEILYVNGIITRNRLKDYRGNILKCFDDEGNVVIESEVDLFNNTIKYTDYENHKIDFEAKYDGKNRIWFKNHDSECFYKYDDKGNMIYKKDVNTGYEYFAEHSDIVPDLITKIRDSDGKCIKTEIEKIGNVININKKDNIQKIILDDRGNTIYEDDIDFKNQEQSIIIRAFDSNNKILSYLNKNYFLENEK